MGKTTQPKKPTETKTLLRQKIFEYLSNPDNPPVSRTQLAKNVLGYRNSQQLYSVFSVDELAEIDREAVEVRRKRYASVLSRIDQALIEQISKGDTAAIKLFYQRFEGWRERQDLNVSGDLNITVVDRFGGND